MQLMKERILREGKVKNGSILKVDSFLNQQMDIELFEKMADEFWRLFGDCNVTKILTIEASGIGIACLAGQRFKCPVVFAKKNKTSNISDDVFSSLVHSFTHGKEYEIMVSREYLLPSDRVLIIDDFLANGAALNGLIDLVRSAGAYIVGAGIAIEKAFQPGGDIIRNQGIRVESLARIKSMDENDGIEFY
ncbi:MAG: xanthine phosphoribosyltransferase [Clostridiaceae bacterium]|jgi:xanthine phosphoribosyltransferase|nr:xanthine phosphoribosyltransferase [Clostridiaceae bacterium]